MGRRFYTSGSRDEKGRICGPSPIPVAVRFWEKVDKRGPNECWPWLAAINSVTGYGAFGPGAGAVVAAHRLAWALSHGTPAPPGLDVCHHCDNRRCCNPNHLFIGTRLDNVRDMDAKGRRVIGVTLGEKHPHAKINEATVRAIRWLRIRGASLRDIAERLGLTKAHVAAVASGRIWRHVP